MLNLCGDEHISQRELVVEQLRAADGPTLLGGDFNVRRHGSLVRRFANAG